jgi:hypothetical protein
MRSLALTVLLVACAPARAPEAAAPATIEPSIVQPATLVQPATPAEPPDEVDLGAVGEPSEEKAVGTGFGTIGGLGRLHSPNAAQAVGAAGVGPALARESIAPVVRAAADEVRKCYQAALVQNPDLQGRVVVAFTVELDGKVSQASAAETMHPSVDACVVGVIAALIFPKPDGAVVHLRYPFVFKSQ